jgi:hypothetical protein
MRERAAAVFPLVLAAAFPPAGLILAAATVAQGDRDGGIRLALAAVLGAVIWTLVFTA